MQTRFTFAVIAAALLCLVTVNEARADDNRFAVVTVRNDTKDVTVHFSYRWGNGEWKTVKDVKPGHSHWFSYRLDDQGKAPNFEIKINEAIGNAKTFNKSFTLRWNAAPDEGSKFGHQHSIQRDKSDNDYISVYDLGK